MVEVLLLIMHACGLARAYVIAIKPFAEPAAWHVRHSWRPVTVTRSRPWPSRWPAVLTSRRWLAGVGLTDSAAMVQFAGAKLGKLLALDVTAKLLANLLDGMKRSCEPPFLASGALT